MAVILHILQKSEERRFRVENRHGFKIAQNWHLTKCLNSQLFWKRKKRFVFEKVIFDIFGRFSTPDCTKQFIEGFEVLLYFRLMEVLQIYGLKISKIVNFLFFEKTIRHQIRTGPEKFQ